MSGEIARLAAEAQREAEALAAREREVAEAAQQAAEKLKRQTAPRCRAEGRTGCAVCCP